MMKKIIYGRFYGRFVVGSYHADAATATTSNSCKD